MKYSRGKWEPRKDYKGKLPSPLHIIARSQFSSIGTAFLTDPDSHRRTPEFAGNAALMLGAPELFRMLEHIVECDVLPAKHQLDAGRLLGKIVKQAEELCPRKN